MCQSGKYLSLSIYLYHVHIHRLFLHWDVSAGAHWVSVSQSSLIFSGRCTGEKCTSKVYFSDCRSGDFRPMYGRLHEIRALIPREVPFLACTATITHIRIRQECIEQLDMSGCEFVSFSPDRPKYFLRGCLPRRHRY